MISPAVIAAALLTLLPFLYAVFFPESMARLGADWPLGLRLGAPALLVVPYGMVAEHFGIFAWRWFALYALLPVAVAWLLWLARRMDPGQRGTWCDFVVLLGLGLAVDLRWLEPAWPAHLAAFSKFLLLDAGLYGFMAVRRLEGAGVDLRVRGRDLKIGLREFCFYAPIAIGLGLWMGFLHLHMAWPPVKQMIAAPLFTFFFIAAPEEIFFRGWLQNLLGRRMGRGWALSVTAVLFGLSHFNKRAVHFNWRYVVLAAIAGVFYGRAWMREGRVASSAMTHTAVDSVWSLWLR